MSNLFWISWYQPTEDYRPLHFPPLLPVLGWWCSGYADDAGATLCAWVEADDEAQARDVIRKDWPEAEVWRFCEPRDHITRESRFPLSDWMHERVRPFLRPDAFSETMP